MLLSPRLSSIASFSPPGFGSQGPADNKAGEPGDTQYNADCFDVGRIDKPVKGVGRRPGLQWFNVIMEQAVQKYMGVRPDGRPGKRGRPGSPNRDGRNPGCPVPLFLDPLACRFSGQRH